MSNFLADYLLQIFLFLNLYHQNLRFTPYWYLCIAGKVLDEVLSAVKSSATGNVAMYFSDPRVSKVKRYGVLDRHLLEGTSNGTTGCDALCRSRAVILEGIFVVSSLFIFLSRL